MDYLDFSKFLNFSKFLGFSMPPLEIVIRGTLMYWFLFLLLRFVLRRDTSSAGISGILFLVLLGDAAQNAMIGNGNTVADGGLLIATLAAWNYLLDYATTHVSWLEMLGDPQPVLLVRSGRLVLRNLRSVHLSRDELQAKLRIEGVENFNDVKKMYLEGDGSFSVIKASRR